ncbi:MAG: MBL fold metallo-hydrolase [Rhizobiales bacterium]|nr:MBL fold metallo-hydrolase [Hyphomicrobiales bacterium]
MTVIAQSLSSGSSGNGFLVRSGATVILVDCGLGPRVLAAAMRPHGLAPRDLSAILITHEHDDHVRGLAPLRKLRIPIRCSAGTAGALRLEAQEHAVVSAGCPFECGEALVTPIAVSHDAAEPMGYAMTLAGFRICVVTDLGTPNEELAVEIASADLIVLESNHDEHMLRSGPYPAYLKRRVASENGHLSNRNAGAFLEQVLRAERRRRTIWLAHLSQTNNHPDLARRTVASAFGDDAALHDIVPLPRRTAGPIWRPEPVPRTLQLDFIGSVNS